MAEVSIKEMANTQTDRLPVISMVKKHERINGNTMQTLKKTSLMSSRSLPEKAVIIYLSLNSLLLLSKEEELYWVMRYYHTY
jgi:hypothetical protein